MLDFKGMFKCGSMNVCGKILMVVISVVLLLRSSIVVNAEQNVMSINKSDVYNAGYGLLVEESRILEFSKNGSCLLLAEYEDGKRSYKKGLVESVFEYENDLLKREIRDGIVIEYYTEYDIEINSYRYIGYEVEDEKCYYVYDDEFKITGITDVDGNQIAKYLYEGLYVTDVMQKEGEAWVSNTDSAFCGNYNKIRIYGAYYDDETDLFYSNGVYDDVLNGKIVGMCENNIVLSEENPFATHRASEDGIMLLGYENQDLEAELWAGELLSNSTFNSAKANKYYESNSVTTVEIIARAIYGENNKQTMDQRAIAWIILNRFRDGGFGNSFRGIVGNPKQFNGVNSEIGRKAQSSTDLYWRNAVYLACLIITDSSEDCWNIISPKPKGITNQLYFRSASSLGNTSQVYESNGKLYAHYSGGDVIISNACIAGEGTATTIAGLKALCPSSLKKYNVFFYHE